MVYIPSLQDKEKQINLTSNGQESTIWKNNWKKYWQNGKDSVYSIYKQSSNANEQLESLNKKQKVVEKDDRYYEWFFIHDQLILDLVLVFKLKNWKTEKSKIMSQNSTVTWHFFSTLSALLFRNGEKMTEKQTEIQAKIYSIVSSGPENDSKLRTF